MGFIFAAGGSASGEEALAGNARAGRLTVAVGGPRGYWPYTEREVLSFMGSRRKTSVASLGREAHFASAVVAYVQVRLGLGDRTDRKGATVHLVFRGLRKNIHHVRFRGRAFLPGQPEGRWFYLLCIAGFCLRR